MNGDGFRSPVRDIGKSGELKLRGRSREKPFYESRLSGARMPVGGGKWKVTSRIIVLRALWVGQDIPKTQPTLGMQSSAQCSENTSLRA